MIHYFYLFTLFPTLLYIHIKPYALWWIDMFIDRINGHSVSYLVFDCVWGFFCFSPPQWNGKPNNELIIFFLDWLMIIFSFFLSFFLTTFVLFFVFFRCFAGIWATTSWLLLASAPSEDSTRCAICKSISPVDPSSPSSSICLGTYFHYTRIVEIEGEKKKKKNHYAYTTFFSFFLPGTLMCSQNKNIIAQRGVRKSCWMIVCEEEEERRKQMEYAGGGFV